uniref:SSD domain-containing protein n=1 Tax=Meloidogyne javanica TaxID=6303 RepID=A0A915M6K9_MELJA
MALPNSYLHDFQMQFEMALRNMQPISVFVLHPGDMRDLQQLSRIRQLVWDFEHALNSYGQESTFFWLQQYEDFLRFYSNGNDNFDDHEIDPSDEFSSPRFTYTEIPAFFKSAAYFYLSSFVHYNESACRLNRPECINSFFFVTNFHRVIKYHELVPTVNEWRRIAAHYSDMQVYAYSDHTPFVDQTISIDQTVLGSVAAALFCTCIVCMLFIPYFLSVIAAVFSVFSISWGIFGILSMWNIDLDPISMASLLMAIGISVDFTAHISYHYYKAPEGNPRLRMQQALTVIGYPMVQVGVSTIVALLPLLFKQSYLAMVFLKVNVVKENNENILSQKWRESRRSSKSNSNFSAGSASSDAGLGSSGGESSKSSTRLDSDSEGNHKRKFKNKILEKSLEFERKGFDEISVGF